MNTYSLLLVDDEEEVTQVIEKKDRSGPSFGFRVIGHANNGLKALEMIEEFQPDVVMTDIRMPCIGRDAAFAGENQKPISDNKNFVIYRL